MYIPHNKVGSNHERKKVWHSRHIIRPLLLSDLENKMSVKNPLRRDRDSNIERDVVAAKAAGLPALLPTIHIKMQTVPHLINIQNKSQGLI
mmetsp:Transcript_27267/g.34819  ORF Transcript_27267/g.34819 Transcript_27267/m.34819 type:complete len:91 (-) Transcript_27267:251-523(-)